MSDDVGSVTIMVRVVAGRRVGMLWFESGMWNIPRGSSERIIVLLLWVEERIDGCFL